jgi:hypothetical protein
MVVLTRATYIGIVPQEDFFKVYKIRSVYFFYVDPCTACFGKNQMERFCFIPTSANDKYIMTNEKWTLKKLTKNKGDNYIKDKKEFTELVGGFSKTAKRFRST